uniref:Protein-lysine N-methyltransferase n=1 Tax=Ciona savignyi TaxID=51511 RepID=H2YNF4_CIOSA
MADEELNPSVLGTYDHWNQVYKDELKGLEEFDDPGTEWFGKSATNRMVKWISKCSDIKEDSRILDVGCGNGLMLLALAKLGYKNLVGIDYCQSALDLASAVFRKENFENVCNWIQMDLTSQTLIWDKNCYGCVTVSDLLETEKQVVFDVCLDKGTYDAISLNPENSKKARQSYIENMARIMNHSSIFVITSCNWTANELAAHFSGHFELLEELPAPSFTFGGKTGNTVSACVFKIQ